MTTAAELNAGYPGQYHPKMQVPQDFLDTYEVPFISNQRAVFWGYTTACNFQEIPQLAHVLKNLAKSVQKTNNTSLDLSAVIAVPRDGKLWMLDYKQIKAVTSAIQFTPLVTRVVVANIDLGDKGLCCLCPVFSSNRHIVKVHVINAKITKDGIADLAPHLVKNRSHLETLSLKGNKLGDQGIKDLCEHLKTCTINTLLLPNCSFARKGFKCLSNLLCTEAWTQSLRNLDVGGNDAGTSGSKALATWLAVAQSVESLVLADTNVDLEPIFDALTTNIEDVANRSMKKIDLSGLRFSPAAANAFGHILGVTESLELVYLKNCRFQKSAFYDFLNGALKNKKGAQFEFDLSECEISEKGVHAFTKLLIDKRVCLT